jgi:putative flippase GtrA
MSGFASPARRAVLHRLIRYGSVSAISTVTSLIILGLLVGLARFPAIWANVIATSIGTVPSFELNRRWVWAQRGPRSLPRQALPFVLLSFFGLVVSTLAVHLASAATMATTRLIHTAAVEAANVAAYGALWIVQFVLCDRILFRARTGVSEDVAVDEDVSVWQPFSEHSASGV